MAIFEKKLNVRGQGGEKKDVAKKSESKDAGETKSMKDLYEGSSSKSGAVKVKRSHGNAYRVLLKPVITEKATDLTANNKYVFVVANNANKIEIAKAIEEVYAVHPTDVNIVKMQGKKITQGRYTGKRKDWKKAIVTLPKDKSIQVYEGV